MTSHQNSLSGAVNMSLANLVGLASKNAEPIRAQIAEIKADLMQLGAGDYGVPALKQAVQSLEEAESSTMDKAKEALGLIIAQWCREHGIALAPVQVGRVRQSSRRLTADEKAKAAQAIMAAVNAGESLSRGEAARLTSITPEQAASVLKKLVGDGKVATEGKGKNTKYRVDKE